MMKGSSECSGIGKSFWLGGHSLKLHSEQFIYENLGGGHMPPHPVPMPM